MRMHHLIQAKLAATHRTRTAAHTGNPPVHVVGAAGAAEHLQQQGQNASSYSSVTGSHRHVYAFCTAPPGRSIGSGASAGAW